MNWTLTQLRTLVAIADHGTMTRAAAALGYTTGAVSQHVAALQRVTGTTLFAPRGRRVELTRAGRALLPRARQVLAAEAQAADTLRGAGRAEAHALTLGVFGSASVIAFQPVVERLAGQDVDIRAFEVDVEVMQEAVLSGRIDVGIGVDYPASPLAPQRGLEMIALCNERFAVVGSRERVAALVDTAELPAGMVGVTDVDSFTAPSSLPTPCPGASAPAPPASVAVAGSGRDARLAGRLARQPWILPPNDSTLGRALRFACADLGVVPIEKHIVTDTAVALVLAAAGSGLTLATPIMMELAPARAAVLPGSECGERTIVAMTRTEFVDRPAAGLVVGALREVFGRR